jgi:hypothetical protein
VLPLLCCAAFTNALDRSVNRLHEPCSLLFLGAALARATHPTSNNNHARLNQRRSVNRLHEPCSLLFLGAALARATQHPSNNNDLI